MHLLSPFISDLSEQPCPLTRAFIYVVLFIIYMSRINLTQEFVCDTTPRMMDSSTWIAGDYVTSVPYVRPTFTCRQWSAAGGHSIMCFQSPGPVDPLRRWTVYTLDPRGVVVNVRLIPTYVCGSRSDMETILRTEYVPNGYPLHRFTPRLNGLAR